jgi:hypothetical protein
MFISFIAHSSVVSDMDLFFSPYAQLVVQVKLEFTLSGF